MSETNVLEGIRIIDASTLLAAPLSAGLLGDFGAEVIKIEHPKKGDPLRNMYSEAWKVSARNKQNITLDFNKEEAIDIFYDLVKNADVVVTNYRALTLGKWQIDYEDLVKVNENIVMLHLSAYGRSGPNANLPGFARIAEGFSGLVHATGYPDRKPVFAGYPLADAIGGVYGAFSIMLALYHYKQTGEGQLIDLSLYEPLVRIMEDYIVSYDIHGAIPERKGTHNPEIAPNDIYETQDNNYIILPVSTDNMFHRLMKAIGHENLTEDNRFLTNQSRVNHREELDGYINEFFEKHDLEELSAILTENKVAYGKVYNVADIYSDSHVRSRDNIIKVFDKELNQEISMQGVVPKLSKTPGKVKWPGSEVGGHNKSVYQDLLGFDDKTIKSLRDNGII